MQPSVLKYIAKCHAYMHRNSHIKEKLIQIYANLFEN